MSTMASSLSSALAGGFFCKCRTYHENGVVSHGGTLVSILLIVVRLRVDACLGKAREVVTGKAGNCACPRAAGMAASLCAPRWHRQLAFALTNSRNEIVLHVRRCDREMGGTVYPGVLLEGEIEIAHGTGRVAHGICWVLSKL